MKHNLYFLVDKRKKTFDEPGHSVKAAQWNTNGAVRKNSFILSKPLAHGNSAIVWHQSNTVKFIQ